MAVPAPPASRSLHAQGGGPLRAGAGPLWAVGGGAGWSSLLAHALRFRFSERCSPRGAGPGGGAAVLRGAGEGVPTDTLQKDPLPGGAPVPGARTTRGAAGESRTRSGGRVV